MFVVYIITKQKEMILKLIRKPDVKVFTYSGFEYRINPERIYSKKFLFMKYFFWTMYIQDNPEPLEFKDDKLVIPDQDIPMDEIAYIIKQLRKDVLTKIAEVMAIVGGIAACIAVYYGMKNLQNSQDILLYVQELYRLAQESSLVVPTG
jgi:hypothetical protein